MEKNELERCLKERDNTIVRQADSLIIAEERIGNLMAELVNERAANARKLTTIVEAGIELARLRNEVEDCEHVKKMRQKWLDEDKITIADLETKIVPA